MEASNEIKLLDHTLTESYGACNDTCPHAKKLGIGNRAVLKFHVLRVQGNLPGKRSNVKGSKLDNEFSDLSYRVSIEARPKIRIPLGHPKHLSVRDTFCRTFKILQLLPFLHLRMRKWVKRATINSAEYFKSTF